MKAPPICPRCGNPAKASKGKFGDKAECCGLWSWGGKPLVDRETHFSRIQAHAAFDPIWKDKIMSRSAAYSRLADMMQMSKKDCHISLMNARDARRVIELCPRLRDGSP
jgi:hypothetical protein